MMAEAGDHHPLQSKHKPISALLTYAAWLERDGRPKMFNTILHAARASKMSGFMWHHVTQFVSTLFSKASPHATILASPHIPWFLLTDRKDLIRLWAAAAFIVPHTEEVAQGVVDTLLQIASSDELVSHIPVGLWSWLIKRPSLPPVCTGCYLGTDGPVVEVVRALKDIEVLKSYFLLVWSEWDYLYNDCFDKMRTSILEDFSGVGMGCHRADLIQRLDHVLEQLDRGLEYLTQHNPDFTEGRMRRMKNQYQKLRGTLLETNTKAIIRMLNSAIATFRHVLTPTLDAHRIPRGIYVCTSSPVPIVSRLEHSVPPFHTLFVLRYLIVSPAVRLIVS